MKDVTRELIAISRLFGVFEREVVCCGSVTIPQCAALQFLLEEAKDITRLARLMGVSNSAMTRLVDGMERRGWVNRIRGEDDRRRVDVKLSSAGSREANRLREITEDTVRKVLAFIPQTKHDQLLESLRLVRSALMEAQTAARCCDLENLP